MHLCRKQRLRTRILTLRLGGPVSVIPPADPAKRAGFHRQVEGTLRRGLDMLGTGRGTPGPIFPGIARLIMKHLLF